VSQTIGNLTLVTKKLNPAMSNGPWPDKLEALNQHSVLMLNRHLVQQNPELWDEAAIRERTAFLASYIKRIWPGPEAEWSVPARSTQLRFQQPPSDTDANEPPPEALIKRFARGEAEDMMLQLLDDMAVWGEDVKVRVGKAPRDQARLIYVMRKGFGVGGSFCQFHPKSGEIRLRIDPDEIESPMRYARVLDKGNYRVVLTLRNSKMWSEAASLARYAYDELDSEDEDDL
jgi:hypothetical protein